MAADLVIMDADRTVLRTLRSGRSIYEAER
jgi:hypothetical protein